MIAKTRSASLKGIDAFTVEVETDCADGLPAFDVVGLPDSAVKESRERVRSALKNSGFPVSGKRITVNLAPGDVRKEGSGFDLPIALTILTALEIIPQPALADVMIVGELSLDGQLKPVKGVLSIMDQARKSGIPTCIIPCGNRQEGALIDGVTIYAAKTLTEVVAHLLGKQPMQEIIRQEQGLTLHEAPDTGIDFADVKGQERVKRAFTIAAAGAHNILMLGPPGVGKTMMARRLPTILPPLSADERIEVTKIYSAKSLLMDKHALMTERPFRSTHHTISHNALVGGGSPALPGEISLAHNGVLFLDEIAEFSKGTLDALRQPMEDKFVVISRVLGTVKFPSNFMLVGACNPCPCGYLGDPEKCTCSAHEITRYMGKLSGPLMDRIDLHIELSPLKYEELNANSSTDVKSSSQMLAKVLMARDMQHQRYRGDSIRFNAGMQTRHIQQYCAIGANEQKLLGMAFDKLGLSARAYHRILKVARTIADLEGVVDIQGIHLMEAIQLRNMERKLWQD